jgi:hypothetical protein
MCERIHDEALTEYLARVIWIKTVDKSQAYFKPNSGLFSTQLIRASLSGQPRTIAYLEESFEVSIKELLDDPEQYLVN